MTFAEEVGKVPETHVFTLKARFTLHFPQINAFFAPQYEQNTVPQIWILFR